MKLTFIFLQRRVSHQAAKKPLAIGKLVYLHPRIPNDFLPKPVETLLKQQVKNYIMYKYKLSGRGALAFPFHHQAASNGAVNWQQWKSKWNLSRRWVLDLIRDSLPLVVRATAKCAYSARFLECRCKLVFSLLMKPSMPNNFLLKTPRLGFDCSD